MITIENDQIKKNIYIVRKSYKYIIECCPAIMPFGENSSSNSMLREGGRELRMKGLGEMAG